MHCKGVPQPPVNHQDLALVGLGIFLPILVKKAVEKAGENFQKQQQYAQGKSWQKTATNDEIIIDTSNAKKPRETKKVGEYVDYEEID